MKKIIILDVNTNEVHIYKLPMKYWDYPDDFVGKRYSEHGQTFKPNEVDYMVVDLDKTEGRLPIYIHD